MFYIHNFTKINHFKIKNKYTLIYQYIYGSFGNAKLPNIDEEIWITRNYRGRPLGTLIDEKLNTSISHAEKEYIYYHISLSRLWLGPKIPIPKNVH